MRLVVALVLVLLAGGQAAAAAPEIPPEAKAREARLLAKASPAVKAWVRGEGQRLRKAGDVNEGAVLASTRARFGSTAGLADGDIMAIAFLVMMEAAKGAQEDLKSVMAQVKSINAAKAQQRAAKDKLDSMSEMGETESLRLQMAVDRTSKLMSTLSNLLKKTSDTQSSIIQNIK